MFFLGGLLGFIFLGMMVLISSICTTIVLESVFGIHVMPNAVDKTDPKIFPWIMLAWLTVVFLFLIWRDWKERREHRAKRNEHGTT